MSGLRINISGLSEGIHHYSLESEPSEIGLDERFNRPVHVKASVEKANRQLLLHAEPQSGGRFVCDRCLDEFQRDVDAQYSIVYIQGQDTPHGAEEDILEVQYLSPDLNILDLGEDVRQFLLLSLPLKNLCREDCAGLCPVCGGNRNRNRCSCAVEGIDPRWADLKRLKN
ncbi:MAG: DUF177 domain-containing protein [Ignavibacteriales bacterium]|nr:DUF177 domain-containing protein [Ignavibacteriales bacterium]